MEANYSRYQMRTKLEVETVSKNLEIYGKSKFKATTVIVSPTKKGWYVEEHGDICADNIPELLFDMNDRQVNIDYDAQLLNEKI